MNRAHRDRVAAARLQRRRRARRRARSRAALLGLVAVGAVAGSAALESMPPREDADGATLAVAATESSAADEPDQPEATPHADPREVAPTPAAYQLYLERDPFESVVPEPTPSGGGGSTTGDADESVATDRPSFSTDPDDDESASDDEDAADDGADAPSTGELCSGGPVELVCAGRVVTLESIGSLDGERAADVRVDTAVHTARPGEVFADDFMLGRIGDGSVMLAFRGEVHELQVDGAIK